MKISYTPAALPLDEIESQLADIQAKTNALTPQVAAASPFVKEKQDGTLDATSIKQYPAFQYNETQGAAPDMGSTLAKANGEMSLADFQIARLQEKAKDLATAKGAQKSSIWDDLSEESQKTKEQKTAELEKDSGIDTAAFLEKRVADQAELKSLYEAYNSLTAAKDKALLNDQSQAATSGFVNKAMNRTEREWNIRLNQAATPINLKLAIMAAEKEDFADAQSWVSKAVDNWVYDKNLELKQIEQVRSDNEELIRELGSETESLFNNVYETQKTALKEAKENAEYIASLRLKYADAPWPTDIFNLTPEEAVEIAGQSPSLIEPDTDIVSVSPGTNLVDKNTGQVIYSNPKADTPTTAEAEQAEIDRVEYQLGLNKGDDGFVNPQVYLTQRRRSTLSPTEFDRRFGDMLSPQERKNLGLDKQSVTISGLDYGSFNLPTPVN